MDSFDDEAERPPPTFKVDSLGNYVIIANSLKPPTAISGNFYKLGHLIKNWKYRFVVVVGGSISYYQTNSFGPMTLKGTFSLKGYSVRKFTKRQIYLSPNITAGEGKDLLLHLPKKDGGNRFSLQVWVQAIRGNIRYANQTYCDSMDWAPAYEALQRNKSLDLQRSYQVVRIEGISSQTHYDETSQFVASFHYHQILEISEFFLTENNDLRGRLRNGDGWVTISTNDGKIHLTEVVDFSEVNSIDEEYCVTDHLAKDDGPAYLPSESPELV